jgi:parvulin-like peptidyl-prolyl isomerase
MQTRLMKVTLKLDDAQEAKASRLNLETARRTQSALAPARDPSAPPRQRYQAMRAVRMIQEEKDDALRGFLNKDQWKSYRQQKEQMKELMREAWQQRAGP